MKNPDYLVMCSKCEIRIHPDDYKKHKKHCNPLVEYIPYPAYPIYPERLRLPWEPWQPSPWWGTTPYVHTTTAGTATGTLEPSIGTASSASNALSS